MKPAVAVSVEAYIAAAPLPARRLMQQLRNIIRDVAPEAEETISYRMPMYKYHGMLVGFAAFPNHVGFYAISNVAQRYPEELAPYHTGKGSVQFPLGQRLPALLVRKLVKDRVAENDAKAAAKAAQQAAKKAAKKKR